MTATKSKYKVAIYTYGLRQWQQEAVYDRLTIPPHVVAVAPSEDVAQAWIDAEMRRQEAATPILPGQGHHYLYATIRLDSPEAYMSRQNAQRDFCDIGLRKKALIENPEVIKL